MEFLMQFLVPLFGLLTAILIATTIWQMKTNQKHEASEADRHSTISNNQTEIIKEVQKVNKKIDDELLPSLTDAFTKKPHHIFGLEREDMIEALTKIGYENCFASDDGGLFLIGVEDDDICSVLGEAFKAYFFIHPNIESKDIMLESHCYEFSSYSLDVANIILSLNDKFKISGFSIENHNGRYVTKCQYLIDAPNSNFSSKTLDFAISCLFEAQKELSQALKELNVDLQYIEPADLISLQREESIPNKAIKAD